MRLADMLRNKGKPVDEGDFTQQSTEEWREEIRNIATQLVVPSPYQPRSEFDDEGIGELANSISEHGVLHPIVVRPVAQGYELIVGERRLRACKRLGWETVPAIVRRLSDKVAAEMALIENLQRRDLDFFEEAEGYRRLIDEFQLTQEELAQRIGKSQSSIANKLRLLRLPERVRKDISREIFSERHCRALLKLTTEDDQVKVVKIVSEKQLTVKQTEDLVARILSSQDKEKLPKQSRKIVFKDVRLFSNSLKKLTDSLESSGLAVDLAEEDSDETYKVTVTIRKPGGRE